jgi:hypothetical protein
MSESSRQDDAMNIVYVFRQWLAMVSPETDGGSCNRCSLYKYIFDILVGSAINQLLYDRQFEVRPTDTQQYHKSK